MASSHWMSVQPSEVLTRGGATATDAFTGVRNEKRRDNQDGRAFATGTNAAQQAAAMILRRINVAKAVSRQKKRPDPE